MKTTLSTLGVQTSVDLLHHAYGLAVANMHIFLGYSIRPAPTPEEFRSRLFGDLRP